MRVLLKKISRELTLLILFFLPQEKKIAIERRQRGKEEYRKLRLADAVIVSFGKSGRTWLRVMLSRFYQVRHGLSERHLIGFDNLHRKDPKIPKLFFTHDNYLKDYTGNSDNKADYYDRKVVLLVRNPADTAVSQYFQWKYRMRDRKKSINQYPQGMEDLSVYDFVMDEKAGLPKIIGFMNVWAREMDRFENILIVRYEDMRDDPGDALQRVTDFIGTEGSKDQIEESVRFASVENMRNMETNRTFWLSGSRMVTRDKSNPNAYKVRRAKVGGYRDYFEDEQIREIEDYINKHLSPVFGYSVDTQAQEAKSN
ncbi:sulfotransferase domain-containing protein [Fodinicurvata sediminis]|uniref:sulfotransferase domain-containing protein n=1 Tax=Fodinicurvata sediminis TaxID=1121832 RepID=UPI00040EB795|nr:sulfotransferase domain-containing protein [Fodinicurvata sediminis]